jgi:hypothetical protein
MNLAVCSSSGCTIWVGFAPSEGESIGDSPALRDRISRVPLEHPHRQRLTLPIRQQPDLGLQLAPLSLAIVAPIPPLVRFPPDRCW